MYEFEKHPKLTEFVLEMASSGKAPQEWTSFIETLNQALRIHDDVEYEYYYEGSKARIIIQNGNDPIIECNDEEFQVKLKNLEYRLKISSDNTVNIHPIKDTYTRDEVEQLCVSAYEDGFYEGTKKDSPCKDPVFWLKENL